MKRMHFVKSTALALLVLIAATAWAEEDRSRDFNRITGRAEVRGAWKVRHIPGDGGPPPFLMLMVFTRDGGVVQTDAGPPNPLQFSPGMGEWKRTDEGRYIASYTQLEFDAGQNHIGIFNALMDVTVDASGNALSGTVRIRFSDLDGAVLFEAVGAVEGTRLPIE